MYNNNNNNIKLKHTSEFCTKNNHHIFWSTICVMHVYSYSLLAIYYQVSLWSFLLFRGPETALNINLNENKLVESKNTEVGIS